MSQNPIARFDLTKKVTYTLHVKYKLMKKGAEAIMTHFSYIIISNTHYLSFDIFCAKGSVFAVVVLVYKPKTSPLKQDQRCRNVP